MLCSYMKYTPSHKWPTKIKMNFNNKETRVWELVLSEYKYPTPSVSKNVYIEISTHKSY